MAKKKKPEPYVLKGFSNPQWNEKQKALIASFERNKNVPGPCSCGKKEVARCELCGNPTCKEEIEICHDCFEQACLT